MEIKNIKKNVFLNENKDQLSKKIIEKILKNCKLIEKMDVGNVKPAFFPYEVKKTFLWDDEINYCIDLNIVKKNTKFQGDFVLVNKGINYEKDK